MRLLPSILLFAPYAAALNNTIIEEYVFSVCPGRRTLSNIITSCVTTLFASTWTAIHPNIPGPAESGVAVAIHRLVPMFLTLAAPEFVVMWAIRQLYAARTTQERFQKALRDGTLELRVKPCCEPRLVSGKAPCSAGEVKIPIPEEATKSCFEMLASLCSSIITMCCRPFSHVHEKLGPSAVLADYSWTLKHSFYAWMGGFTLYVPPSPHEVYYPLTPDELLEFLEKDLVEISMISEKALDDRSKEDWLSKTVAIVQLVWFVAQLAARYIKHLPTTQLEIGTLAVAILSCVSYAFWWYKPKNVRCSVPVYWKGPGDPPNHTQYSTPQSISELLSQYGAKKNWFVDSWCKLSQPILNLQGGHCVSDADIKARRVPSLCGYPPDQSVKAFGQSIPIFFCGYLCGMVFGVVHCIAWNFAFPTPTEKMLWRISSVAITAIPGLLIIVIFCSYRVAGGETLRHPAITFSFFAALGHVWVACAVIKVFLLATTLRSLPDGHITAITRPQW